MLAEEGEGGGFSIDVEDMHIFLCIYKAGDCSGALSLLDGKV